MAILGNPRWDRITRTFVYDSDRPITAPALPTSAGPSSNPLPPTTPSGPASRPSAKSGRRRGSSKSREATVSRSGPVDDRGQSAIPINREPEVQLKPDPRPPRATLGDVLERAETTDAGGPSNILQTIGQRFVHARALNRPESWRQLQSDLMTNSDKLVPGFMAYKDLITACREIEDFIKGTSGQVGKSNEELLGAYLRGGSIEEVGKVASAAQAASPEPKGDTVTAG